MNYLEAIGFDYKEDDTMITHNGEDLSEFYTALIQLKRLSDKYDK